MTKYLLNILICFTIVVPMMIGATGCSTGIERTKTVKLTKADKKFLIPTPEDMFMDSITTQQLGQWKEGKVFKITDNKVSLLYEVYDNEGRRCHGDSLAGENIQYSGIKETTDAAGNTVFYILFSIPQNGKHLQFRSNKNLDELMRCTWSDFPFLIDHDLVASVDGKLRGRKVWIKSPLWYDKNGAVVQGTKYRPVTILSVTPGNSIFPLNVKFTDGVSEAFVPMNMKGNSGSYESRSFPSLFSLNDPKLSYPNIAPEIWNIICNGELTIGMTKEECKLSLGNPKEVDTGHDWNSLMDYWKYDDGTYLMFQDGRLINFRK